MRRVFLLLAAYLVAGCSPSAGPNPAPPAAYPVPASPVAILADPRVPGLLWASTARSPRESSVPGSCGEDARLASLYRSTDHGTTWQRVAFGAPRLVLDMAQPGALLLACQDAVWRVTVDEPAPQLIYQTADRPVSPEAPAPIPVASSAGSGFTIVGHGRDVAHSTDQGRTWTTEAPPAPADASITAVATADQDASIYTIVGRVFWTWEPSRGWESRAELPETARTLEVSPTAPEALLAASDRAIFRSPDGGRSWDVVYQLPTTPSRWSVWSRVVEDGVQVSIVFDRQRSGRVVAATGPNGLLESLDGGLTWTRRGADEVYGVTMGGEPPSRLYLAMGTLGIYRERADPWPWTREWESASAGLPHQTSSLLDDVLALFPWLFGVGLGIVVLPLLLRGVRTSTPFRP